MASTKKSSKSYQVPPWYDILQYLKSEIFKGIRCCMPGTIAAVNGTTVDVNLGTLQQDPVGNIVKYPTLKSCPIVNVQAGGVATRVGMSFPVTVGDECLVFFSDRCITSWLGTGAAQPLPNFRMHDLSDGFVLMGHTSSAHVLNLFLLSNEGGIASTKAKVAIDPLTNFITIQNNNGLPLNLKTILSTVFAQLATDPGLSAASHTALLLANTQLALLLY